MTARLVVENSLLALAARVEKGTVCIAAVVPGAGLIDIHRMLWAVFPAVAAALVLMAFVDVRSGTV